jgi:glutaryl-CoA dehydrogenase
MLAEVTSMQPYCRQLGRLEEEGRLTDTIAGAGEVQQTRAFEGTETMRGLIVERDITGLGAFAST